MSNSGTTAAKGSFLILVLAVLGLVLGILWIFQLTFQPGSVYPAYSTLRSDPLGGKLFYHSVGELSGTEVNRSHLPLTQVDPGSTPGVFFFVGVKTKDLEKMRVAEVEALEKWLHQGWRLVFTLEPGYSGEDEEQEHGAENPETQPEKKVNETKKETAESGLDYFPERRTRKIRREKQLESSYFKTLSLMNRWDLTLDHLPFPGKEKTDEEQNPKDEVTDHLITALPSENHPTLGPLPLFSETIVNFYSKEWQPVFLRGRDPVVLERKMGKGSVVFITDTYAFSNQSLAREPSLGLLDWCLKDRKVIFFDEFHHGLEASPGVMSLARTLRLEGLFAGLLLLALLLIWKASRAFPPLPDEGKNRDDAEGTATPRDQLDGLSNLLQRGLPPKDLIEACLVEWQLTGPKSGDLDIRSLLPENDTARDKKHPRILETFNKLHQHLHKKIHV